MRNACHAPLRAWQLLPAKVPLLVGFRSKPLVFAQLPGPKPTAPLAVAGADGWGRAGGSLLHGQPAELGMADAARPAAARPPACRYRYPLEAPPPGRSPGHRQSPGCREPDREKVFPGVDAELLAQVQDDTAVGRNDLPSMLQLLSLARRTDPRELAEASVGTPAFVQLLQQPAAFRGQVVTVRGRAPGFSNCRWRRTTPSVRELLQLWIEPEDRPALSCWIASTCPRLFRAAII